MLLCVSHVTCDSWGVYMHGGFQMTQYKCARQQHYFSAAFTTDMHLQRIWKTALCTRCLRKKVTFFTYQTLGLLQLALLIANG